jgi:hypothetical protein
MAVWQQIDFANDLTDFSDSYKWCSQVLVFRKRFVAERGF